MAAFDFAQLQNHIKRDPDSYKDDFLLQKRHFQTQLQIYQLKPQTDSTDFELQINFLSHVAQVYPEEMREFPRQLIDLLETHAATITPELRVSLCKALMLLRNRQLIAANTLLPVLFKLFRVHDKILRELVYNHIVNDIKRLNLKTKHNSLNRGLQNFMYTMLSDANETAAKKSLDVMVELYRKGIWNDQKTVNVISTACFSQCTKILVAALQFFIGEKDLSKEGEDDEDSDETKGLSVKEVIAKHRTRGKKTRKKERKMKEALSRASKNEKRQKVSKPNFPAMQLLNDPQNFTEKLFASLRKSNQRFEVRLMMTNLISRMIATHQLIMPNFYPWIMKYMQPHQQHVTHILAYAAQSCHELVLPETIQPLLRHIANQFVVDRMSNEIQAFGLNAIREICLRCPLAMTDTLLHDLSQYKGGKDKGIRMAAKSLIAVYRAVNPTLLRKKDRGRDADLDAKPKQYGEQTVAEGVEGIELLEQDEQKRAEFGDDYDSDELGFDSEEGGLEPDSDAAAEEEDEEENEDAEEEDDDNEDEEELDGDDEEEEGEEDEGLEEDEPVRNKKQKHQHKQVAEVDEDEDEDEDAADEDGKENGVEADEEEGEEAGEESADKEASSEAPDAVSNASAGAPSVTISTAARLRLDSTRILTPEDFERIKHLQRKAKLAKATGKGAKRAAEVDSDSEEKAVNGAVDPSAISANVKKQRMDKAERVASIMEGREGRDKFTHKRKRSEGSSTTNKEKAKATKNAIMMRMSKKVRSKSKRSLREVQSTRKKMLKKQIKFKIRRGY